MERERMVETEKNSGIEREKGLESIILLSFISIPLFSSFLKC